MWVSLFSALIELDIISITNIFNIHQKKWVWRAVNFQTVPRPDLHKIPKEDDDCCGRHKQEPSGIEKNIMNILCCSVYISLAFCTTTKPDILPMVLCYANVNLRIRILIFVLNLYYLLILKSRIKSMQIKLSKSDSESEWILDTRNQ